MKKDITHLSVGRVGEKIAAAYLKKLKFEILETNVYRKWGELDIVAKNKQTKRIHIIEVKTVSGSCASIQIHPAENLTKSKLEKLERTAVLYTQEKQIANWQLDAVLVWYNEEGKKAQLEYIENIYTK